MTVKALVEGSYKGRSGKRKHMFLMVAGDGEQRWEGDEGGSGSARSQLVNVNGCQLQSVKFLMAFDLGVERKSLPHLLATGTGLAPFPVS